MAPPLVLDIDGTLTLADSSRSPAPLDPELFDRLRGWEAPVIFATGKAFPAPVLLCQFVGRPVRVVAETGGIVCNGERVVTCTSGLELTAVHEAMAERGHDTGDAGLMNRWRETELAFPRDVPLAELRGIAERHGLHVVDTGYAYHVKDPEVSKGRGVDRLLAWESIDPDACIAIGDSANDISVFERVGRAFAVANAHPEAKAAADHVTDEPHGRGTRAVLDRLGGASPGEWSS